MLEILTFGVGASALIPLIVGGTTVASTVLSVAQARAQNKAIRRSIESQKKAAEFEKNQLKERAALEADKMRRKEEQIRGRIAVSVAERGVGFGGSFNTLNMQAGLDRLTNNKITETNLNNQIIRVQSGLQANIDKLSSDIQNPLLAGFTGAMSGLQSGLSLGSGIQKIQANRTPTPTGNP